MAAETSGKTRARPAGERRETRERRSRSRRFRETNGGERKRDNNRVNPIEKRNTYLFWTSRCVLVVRTEKKDETENFV